MSRPTTLSTLLALLLSFAPAAAMGATPVTFCGQTVEGVGFLQGDLDCSDGSSPAITLTKRGVLRLRGFTLTANGNGVQCLGPCRVVGPGAIARATPSHIGDQCIGVSGVLGNKVTVSDVAFTQFGWAIIADKTLRAKRITVSDGCFGVSAGTSVRLIDSTITDNAGFGARTFGRMTVIGSTITGQLRDLWSPVPPKVQDSVCITSSDDTSPPGIDFWGVCS